MVSGTESGKAVPLSSLWWEMDPTLAHNALSRRDTIYVCNKCGMNEAIEDASYAVNPEFVKLPIDDWYVNLIDEC